VLGNSAKTDRKEMPVSLWFYVAFLGVAFSSSARGKPRGRGELGVGSFSFKKQKQANKGGRGKKMTKVTYICRSAKKK
jgi:hypothetical protein